MKIQLRDEFDLKAISRSLGVLLPLFLITAVSGNPAWPHTLIPASATLIVFERVGLAPLGVLVQATAIALGFAWLLFAQEVPLLFVASCAILAALSVALTAYGQRLRSLGTFIFVPALYLACEASRETTPATYPQLILNWLPYLLAGCVPVFLLSVFEHNRQRGTTGIVRHYLKLRRPTVLGPAQAPGLPSLAVTLSVGLAATLVVLLRPENPQWIIWSAASVVAGDFMVSSKKFRDRLLGALLGVPVGIGLGLVLPHLQLTGLILSVLTCTTVLVIRRYVLSFGTRCACAACAVMIANQSWLVASERFFNVALGGLIGATMVFLLYRMYGRR